MIRPKPTVKVDVATYMTEDEQSVGIQVSDHAFSKDLNDEIEPAKCETPLPEPEEEEVTEIGKDWFTSSLYHMVKTLANSKDKSPERKK